MQVIEKTVIERHYGDSALIIAVALVIATIILKWDNIKINLRKKKQKQEKPFYSSQRD